MKIMNSKDIDTAKEIARELIDTANRNENTCHSDICLLIYSILKDCGYNVLKLVDEKFTNNCEH
jgi:hypothetical protein